MSTESDHHFEWRFPNRLSELNRVITEAVQHLETAGIGAQPVYLANLVIEEMGTNILKYGYDDTADHEIRLRMEIQPGSLGLILEDDGHPFNPLTAEEPDVNLPAEERVPGGLGIHLIRKLIDEIQYERLDGRNRLTVRIRR
jgi:anti-sigma regulatory factor (Ser/Thr protein kinase)